ncbi:hypothetical protein RFI_01712, partial [Reticulomyxa filosa]
TSLFTLISKKKKKKKIKLSPRNFLRKGKGRKREKKKFSQQKCIATPIVVSVDVFDWGGNFVCLFLYVFMFSIPKVILTCARDEVRKKKKKKHIAPISLFSITPQSDPIPNVVSNNINTNNNNNNNKQ